MATGMYIRRRAEESFKKEYPSPISCAATEWLADVEHRENVQIEHARNVGEYKVGPRRRAVDGFCRLVLDFNFSICLLNVYFYSFLRFNSDFMPFNKLFMTSFYHFRASNTIYQFHGCW